MKYSQKSTNSNCYEICFYWEDTNGIETLEGLYRWEENDHAINRLYKVKDENEANSIINDKKLLRQYTN